MGVMDAKPRWWTCEEILEEKQGGNLAVEIPVELVGSFS